ncbi:nucleoside diphosphate kinase 2, chloroplastic isoform X2 [Macadamia integrifolia]|uniref:nucleoside diphosphate kinase 2, chloroplastic isoform X2 n=1 Tax=Macadamia integrifolia TaxID=60698 RepID=UPI001C4E32CD|nr:nucleoside diphosphate kinase 2, chloroplastic isoform X2 [Macadamia integrifolia]
MEALAVFGGSPRVSTSSLQSASATIIRSGNGSLSYTQNLTLSTRHLSAFHGSSSLFLCSPSLSHPKRRARKIRPNIFLPTLIASMEDVEETYIMVKPDGVQRGLVGEIISRLEKKGFKLTGLKLFQCPQELAEEHYKDLQAKPFFPKLIQYITSGPVVCMAWEGVGVVASARKLIGATNPLQAEPGTIRGDLAVQTGRNVVHGSDSPENGKREIEALWTMMN